MAALSFAVAASAQDLFVGRAGGESSPAQLERGRAAYAGSCASCHGNALEGNQFGPALTGAGFQSHWRGRPRAALSEKIRTTMPPGRAGSVSSEAYADIEAYVLAANSTAAASAGGAASPDTRAPATRSQSEAAAMFAPLQGQESEPHYLAATKARESKLAALTPVTDALLQHPVSADWLMWRRP